MNKSETEPRKISRRAILKKGAETIAGGVALAFLPDITKSKSWSNGSESTEDFKDHGTLFRRLSQKVDSIQDPEVKERVRKIKEDLQKITSVNDALYGTYISDLDQNGNPRLESLYRNKYAPFQVANPESMIFIASNNKLVEELIIQPLQDLLDQGNEKFDSTLSNIIKKVLEDKTSEGEQRLSPGSHVQVGDYLKVNTKKGGSLEILPGQNINTEKGKQHFEEDAEILRGLASNFPSVGDQKLELWSSRRYEGEDTYPHGRTTGAFIEKGILSEIDLNDTISAFVVYHEMAGHGLDITLNDTQLFEYLSPKTIYDLMVLREEALSDDEWGRSYPGIEKIFKRKTSNPLKPVAEGQVPSATPQFHFSDARPIAALRSEADGYPDGIFLTDYYNGYFLTEETIMGRREDEKVMQEYRNMIVSQGGSSATLGEFLRGPNNRFVKALAEKNPWLGEVFDKLNGLLPEIDDKTYWLPEPGDTSDNSLYKIPGKNAKDSEWFDFCVTVGQRIAVAKMYKDHDSALVNLKPDEDSAYQESLLVAFVVADQEMFANMVGITLANPNLSASKPSPYLKYLTRVTEDLSAKNTNIVPSSELKEAIAAGIRKKEANA